MRTERLEVRCCCQPEKLRGWLHVPGEVRVGKPVKFPLNSGDVLEMCVAEMIEWPLMVSPEILELQVLKAFDAAFRPRRWLALKSDDVPIELLREITGFEEAK